MALRIVFAGTPGFAVPSLRAAAAGGEVVAVYTQPDRPAGRGRGLAASPVKQAALELGLVSEADFDRVVDPAKMVHPYVAGG